MAETSKESNWIEVAQSRSSATRISGVLLFWLLAIAFTANLLFGSVSSSALGVVAIMTALAVGLWVADSFFSHQFGFSKNTLQIPLFALIVIGLIQLLPLGGSGEADEFLKTSSYASLTISPHATKLAILKLFIFSVFFSAFLAYLDSPKRLRYVVFVLIVFAALMSFFGILQNLSNPEMVLWIRQVDYAKPFATYVNQHHFACFLVMTAALGLGLLFAGSTRPDKRVLLIIAIVLMALGVVFTSSRGALLSLVAVLAFLTALSAWFGTKTSSKEHRKSHFRRLAVLVAANVVLIAFVVVSVSFLGGSDLALRSAGVLGPEDVSNGRFAFWMTTVQIFLSNPIIGTGYDSFMTAYTQYDQWNGTIRVNHAHNEYLHVLSEGGILAFSCVVGFIVILFKRGLKMIASTHHPFRRGVAAGGLAACFGVIVHSFLTFPYGRTQTCFSF